MFSLNLHRSLWSAKPHYLINLLSDSPVNTSVIILISHYHSYKNWPSYQCLGRLPLRCTELNCGRAVHLTFNLNDFNSIYPQYAQQTILLLKWTPFSFPSLPKKSRVLEDTTPVPACGRAAIWAEQTWTSQFVWRALHLYE